MIWLIIIVGGFILFGIPQELGEGIENLEDELSSKIEDIKKIMVSELNKLL